MEKEGDILWEDLADQRELLTGIAERLGETKVWRELAGKVVTALDKKWRQQGNYPTIESLEAENLAYRTLIEQLVTAVHDDVADWPNEEKDALHGQLVDYLNRQMAREKILYREPFSGLPF